VAIDQRQPGARRDLCSRRPDYRAAEVLSSLKRASAAGLAVLCVIVLVVVPAALYMLLTLIPSP
jgi:hypothetical protein